MTSDAGSSSTWRVPVPFFVALGALALTGPVGVWFAGGVARWASARVVVGGVIGPAVIYGIRHLFGTAIR